MARMPAISEVVVDRRVYDRFKRRAFDHYPKEYAEQLWGRVDGTRALVDIFQPVELTKQTRNEVDFDFDQPCGTEHSGLTLLGSIHTHPAEFFGTTPSDDDIKAAAVEREIVWGICAIRKTAKRRFAACRFWSAASEVEFVVAE